MAAHLSIEGVAKQFGAARVLDGIDLQIGADEFVALLGPSGCGKTTLLRILCGIESLSAGRILLQGVDISGLSTAQRHFGVVFQSYALFPNLSAADNVGYGLRGQDAGRRRARINEMLDLVGLAAHAQKYPAQLSGGQQQRIALARALAPNPRLLLLDEPLSALDAQVRASLRGEVRALQQRLGIPTIMVTHDQDEAMSMADRVVLMHQGRIEQAGTPRELYARPRNEFVAQFVGRMNLWRAALVAPDVARIGHADFAIHTHGSAASAVRPDVQIGARPEQLRVTPDIPRRAQGASALPANTVLAEIRQSAFHGAFTSLWLHSHAMDAPIEVALTTPPGTDAAWQVGAPVQVQMPPSALTVLST